MGRAASLMLTASLLAACSVAPVASVSPANDASGRIPSASPSLQAPAAPSSTPATSTPLTTTPPTTAPLVAASPTTALPAAAFAWGEPVAMSGLGNLPPYRPLFVYARGAYVVSEDESESPRLWVSDDARRWDVADSPVDGNNLVTLHDLVAGAAGFIAVGTEEIDADHDGSPEDQRAVVLTSSDGRRWERVADQGFEHAGMNLVGLSRQGVVAFGFSRGVASIWTSADGHDWLKGTTETGLQVAKGVRLIAESNGRLTAFVIVPAPTLSGDGPVEVWQTEGLAAWEKVGELPDPSDAHVFHATYGGGRWLALGGVGAQGPRAWSSTDGVHWKHAPSAGVHVEGVNAIAGWAGGLIAAGSTGSEPGEVCGGNEPYVGRTWLATNGTDWQALPPTEGAAITALVIANDRIVGIGQAIRDDGGVDSVMWTAAVPTSPARATPEPTPTPSPTPRNGDGCGG